MKFSTKVIHKGYEPEPQFGSVMPPLYMTSTFAQEAPGRHKGYDYTRAGNPNFTQLEKLLASLENAQHATVFSSGLGAITALLNQLPQKASIVATEGLYGGTFRLFERIFKRYNMEVRFVKEEEIPQALQEKPNLLFTESPTNPLMEVFDLEKICSLAKDCGVLTCVDNTFATPYFQNPLDLGADVVVHSCTKYLGGHSDVVGGVLITNDLEKKREFDFARMAIGLNPSPFDVWLTMRGLKTLAVRMDKHHCNAQSVVDYLSRHPLCKKIYYPGLQEHPKHSIAERQMRGYSGMVSVEFDLPREATLTLASKFKLFTLAESLGGVESLICHPASMTHASIPKEERARIGLSDGLIRLSIGIEDADDIIADIDNALNHVQHLRL